MLEHGFSVVVMEKKDIHKLEIINLLAYRPPNATSFSGEAAGEDLRRILNLDHLDDAYHNIRFIIPAGTTSFNPSFYLGLLFNSFLKLGIAQYSKKYKFIIEDKDEVFRSNLRDNLSDGLCQSINRMRVIESQNALCRKNGRMSLWFKKLLEIQ